MWVHEGFAYVGHWGFSDSANGSKTRFCPSPPKNGIAVVDVSDPADPVVVSRLVNPTGTSAEDVTVFQARFGPFAGRDIAAIGLQVCGGSRLDTSFARGLMLFDVSNPASPVQIGLLNTGCCTRGVHELEFEHRADLGRTFVYASVPTSEYEEPGSPSGYRDVQGRGDFRLIDVTNPAAPVEVSDWGVIHDAGGPLNPGQGCDPDPVYGHSVEPSADGKLAFVAYWDSGFVALDVTNPANPVLKGHTVYGTDEDGDAHSSMYDDARRLLFSADEDFGKHCGPDIEPGYGYLRIWDYSNLAAPKQIGEYRTPNSGGGLPLGSGDYTIHNPMLMGTDVYISWYSDGVRVVDASDPASPEEVAYFVPAGGPEPGEAVPARNALADAAGLGRFRGRGDRSRLRERHEHRPLDPQANRLRAGPHVRRIERRPSGRRSSFPAARRGRGSPRRGIFRDGPQCCRGRGVCALYGAIELARPITEARAA